MVDRLGDDHGAAVEGVLNGLEQLSQSAQGQHGRLGHWPRQGHMQVHHRAHQVRDVGGIQNTLREQGQGSVFNQRLHNENTILMNMSSIQCIYCQTPHRLYVYCHRKRLRFI